MTEHIQTTIRSFVKAGCGALAAKGYVDDSGIEILASAAGLIFSIVWGIWQDKRIKKTAAQTVATNVTAKTETK